MGLNLTASIKKFWAIEKAFGGVLKVPAWDKAVASGNNLLTM